MVGRGGSHKSKQLLFLLFIASIEGILTLIYMVEKHPLLPIGEQAPKVSMKSEYLNVAGRKTVDEPAPNDVFEIGVGPELDPIFEPAETSDDQDLDLEPVPLQKVVVDYNAPIDPALLEPEQVVENPNVVVTDGEATVGAIGLRDTNKKE